MPLSLTDDHLALAETVAATLARRSTLAAARELLEGKDEQLPPFWDDAINQGWTGIHVPEALGGSGFGLSELAVVVEQLGAVVAPGAFVPSAIASAVLAIAGPTDLARGLASGTKRAGVALDAQVELRAGSLQGVAEVVIGGGLANLVLLPIDDDVAVVDLAEAGAKVEHRPNLDPTRRAVRLTLDGAAVTVLPGAAQTLIDIGRIVLAAEAIGVARACTDMAAAYAKDRQQFGRPIGTFQAVKHHCADMLVATELATGAVWDAARAVGHPDQLSYAAAAAAVLAGEAVDLCANLNIQVHGGIAITWEHDAHLYLRRGVTLRSLLAPPAAAKLLVDLTRRGVKRERAIELPPEADQIRTEVRGIAARVTQVEASAQLEALIESGYAMPHWPKPWGRDAGAVEQLVIEQEFATAGINRPDYGITGWNILTIIQHGSDDQVNRWVPDALSQKVIWCQLFSEPDAGSDAAAVKTKATRVEGGWVLNGQKVWTSGAHQAGLGFATVRTNSDVPKHEGITTMVVDMSADGVEIRPLKQISGGSEFNEVFFNDVFVPDDDVVGPVDGGWAVARATLGNESVSLGGGQGARSVPPEVFVQFHGAYPDRLDGGAARVGRYVAAHHAMGLLNLRSANRAVAGGGPGPEGAVTKLAMSELGHESAAMFAELNGPDLFYLDGPTGAGNRMVLMHRALSIAGGTSEIKRNQIGERLLGLPRDPLSR